MIPIKVECGCGQHYAFDAEPVDGRLGAPVACPTCGADGTAVANEVIAQALAAPPVSVPASAPALPVRELPRGASSVARMSMVSREQAEVEARAKVSWGDPPESVLQYLMINGFSHAEADDLIKEMYRERAMAVRGRGVKKILMGVGLIAAGAAGMGYMLSLHYVSWQLAGIMFGLALWGLWLIIIGGLMVLAPKMQGGDVAES